MYSRRWLVVALIGAVLLAVGIYGYVATTTTVSIDLPQYPEPEDNAWSYMVRAGQIAEESHAERSFEAARQAERSGQQPDYVEAAAAYEAALQTLREGLYNDCRVPDPGPDLSAANAQLAGMRALARGLSLEAKALAAQGKADEAMDSIRDCLRLGRNMGINASILHDLAGIAICAIGAKALSDVLNSATPTPEKLVEFVAWNEQNRKNPQSLAHTILLDSDRGMKAMAHQMAATSTGRRTKLLPQNIITNIFWRAQQIYLVKVDKWARQPAFLRGKIPRSLSPMSSIAAPMYSRYAEKRDQSEAKMAGLSIRCALEAYNIRESNYPRTLANLVPDYIAELPADPFSGDDFHYELRTVDGQETYLLHSVAPDGG